MEELLRRNHKLLHGATLLQQIMGVHGERMKMQILQICGQEYQIMEHNLSGAVINLLLQTCGTSSHPKNNQNGLAVSGVVRVVNMDNLTPDLGLYNPAQLNGEAHTKPDHLMLVHMQDPILDPMLDLMLDLMLAHMEVPM